MEYFPPALEALVEQFARLPGIGRKSAQRLAYFLLAQPKEEAEAKALHDAIERRMHPHVDFKGVTAASEACCRQLEQWLAHPMA